jgi:hypothetical protein
VLRPAYVAVSVAWPSDFPRKTPIPSDLAMLGSLDVHTAAVLTFSEAALAMQTTMSPASSVGALHDSVSPVPNEEVLGAVGAALPHADAIDRAALRAAMRPMGMART